MKTPVGVHSFHSQKRQLQLASHTAEADNTVPETPRPDAAMENRPEWSEKNHQFNEKDVMVLLRKGVLTSGCTHVHTPQFRHSVNLQLYLSIQFSVVFALDRCS